MGKKNYYDSSVEGNEVRLELPNGWEERILWNPKPSETVSRKVRGVLAYYNKRRKIIEYYPRWWIAPIWFLLYPAIRQHELGHAHGLRNCVGRHKWCVMYEDKDSWASKLLLIPAKLYGRSAFCPACVSYLRRTVNKMPARF